MSSFQAQLTPDTYYPSIDAEGNYVDRIPFNFNAAQGVYCPCRSRKEKICFTKKPTLSAHFKTNNHEVWIASLNINKHNYFVENEELKKIIEGQKLQISEQSKVISKQNFKINAQIDAIKSLNVMLDIYHKDTINDIDPTIEPIEPSSNVDLIDFNFDIV
jgi:hypothetical protein